MNGSQSLGKTPTLASGETLEAPIATSSDAGATTESYGAAGGLVFHVTYDVSVTSAPAGFKAAFAAAVQFYTTRFSDPITINIDVGWGEVDGIPLSAGDLGGSDWSFNSFSYSQVRSALQANATSADGREAVATLPAGDPTGGGNFLITTAEQKALGLLGASTAVDGQVGFSANDIFSFDPSNRGVSGAYDFIGVAEHEISEVMGRDSFSGQTISGRSHHLYSPMDLFRYASTGTRQLGTGAASYFSIDGGTTDLGNWNNFVTGNGGDLGDWAGTVPYTPDAYNDNSASGVVNPVTQSDIRLMNVIGWDLVPSQPPTPYDFNGDGDSDILWQNTNGQAAVWLMNGTTPTSGPVVGNPGPSWQVIGAADFNGDGDADILWQNTNGQAAIWLMSRTTPISEPAVGNPGPSWQIVGTGDFNGDGDADILWQNTKGQAAIWLMNGTTPISEPVVGSPDPSWHIAGAGDFNGDGDADILWQNTNGEAAIWLMNGTTPISEPVIGNPGPSWHIAGTGDFNGDGDADILWQNTDGEAAIWLMNGTTPISEPTIGNPGPNWHAIGIGDYNGDGKSDILWESDNGPAAVWLMNGTTPISETVVGNNPGPSWYIHAAS